MTSSTVSSAYDADIEGQTVVGKTGTTQEGVDRWFCGYTPYYTAAIWVGYDDNSTPVNNANHIIMFGKIMEQAHKGLAEGHFKQPSDIVQVEICSQSGLLPVEGVCDHDPRGSCIKTEYFAEDNVPTKYCDVHVEVATCDVSHSIATAKCPSITRTIKILKDDLELSDEYADLTTMDAAYAITKSEYQTLCKVHGGTTAVKPDSKPEQTESETTLPDASQPESTSSGSSQGSGTASQGLGGSGTASQGLGTTKPRPSSTGRN